MAHLENEDSTLVGLIQGDPGNKNDPMRTLLRHTIQPILEEYLTVYLIRSRILPLMNGGDTGIGISRTRDSWN